MMNVEKLKLEIVTLLKNLNLDTVLLFGSYAYGNVHDDSDVDLLVVLDKKGVSNDYAEMIRNKTAVSRQLRGLRKRIPIDLLVYTLDEWAILQNSDSSFFEQIEKNGVQLI